MSAQMFVSQMGFCNSGIVIRALVGTLKTSDTQLFLHLYIYLFACACVFDLNVKGTDGRE